MKLEHFENIGRAVNERDDRIAELERELAELREAAQAVVDESCWVDRSSLRSGDRELWQVHPSLLRQLREALAEGE